jgi:hypothetical protein
VRAMARFPFGNDSKRAVVPLEGFWMHWEDSNLRPADLETSGFWAFMRLCVVCAPVTSNLQGDQRSLRDDYDSPGSTRPDS